MATYKTSWVQRLVDNVWTKTFAFAHAKTVYTDYENGKTLDKSLEEINEENTQQSTEMMDIKMLGWSVPRECPIQNEVNGNQFIQKVGRVDLESLDYILESSDSGNQYKCESVKIKTLSALYVLGYTNTQITNWSSLADKCISMHPSLPNLFRIRDDAYTDASAFKSAMQGQYLYYELATHITTTIDGNEIGETVSDVRKETTVNLLNPTLLEDSVSNNGITCTNNNDGTYTFKGTATDTAIFTILNGTTTSALLNRFSGENLKLIGCPNGGSYSTYKLQVYTSNHGQFVDLSNGAIFTVPSDATAPNVAVVFYSGYTANNLTFKPMLTTNLNATYDDFVPYTGDAGSLNGDVADLRSDVDGMGVAHKHSFFETVEVTVNNNDYIYDFYLADGYSFDDLLGGNNCGLAMVYINNGSAIKNSYGMSLLLSINPKIDSSMIGMVYGRTTGPGMNITNVEYLSSGSKKGFRVYGHATFSAVDALKSLYTTVASWTNICNM